MNTSAGEVREVIAEVYRYVQPETPQGLPLRMLFQPAQGSAFFRACEADGFRGLVAAILDDPAYETASLADRLQARIRIANDLALISQLEDPHLRVGDRDEPGAINVHSDEELIRSLERIVTGLGGVLPYEGPERRTDSVARVRYALCGDHTLRSRDIDRVMRRYLAQRTHNPRVTPSRLPHRSTT